jgi:hypothetical protein
VWLGAELFTTGARYFLAASDAAALGCGGSDADLRRTAEVRRELVGKRGFAMAELEQRACAAGLFADEASARADTAALARVARPLLQLGMISYAPALIVSAVLGLHGLRLGGIGVVRAMVDSRDVCLFVCLRSAEWA